MDDPLHSNRSLYLFAVVGGHVDLLDWIYQNIGGSHMMIQITDRNITYNSIADLVRGRTVFGDARDDINLWFETHSVDDPWCVALQDRDNLIRNLLSSNNAECLSVLVQHYDGVERHAEEFFGSEYPFVFEP